MLDTIISDHRAWIGEDIQAKDWCLTVSNDVNKELNNLVEALQRDPLPTLLQAPEYFPLSTLQNIIQQVKFILDEGCGFAVVKGLSVKEHDVNDMVSVFWILGQLIGRPVAQKFDGTMIYDVTDSGKEFGYGIRGSHTRVELNFHIDNAFGTTVPHYVGLLCWQTARSGGVSRFCSLYSLHNRLLSDYPELLELLYRPIIYDRQAEHHPQAAKTTLAPFFQWDGKRLLCRANISLIRKGHSVAGQEINSALEKALTVVEDLLADPAIWVEMQLSPGDLHYLNNINIAHYRSGFIDDTGSAQKRHLYRTWHRDTGRQSYDG